MNRITPLVETILKNKVLILGVVQSSFYYYLYKTMKYIKCNHTHIQVDKEQTLTTSELCQTDLADHDFLFIKHYDGYEVSGLTGMYAGDWCYDKKLVVVHEDMTITDILERMHDAKSSCALMYTIDETLVGVLDTPDVIRFLLRSSSSVQSGSRRLIRQCVIANSLVSVSEICKDLCAGMRYIAVCSSLGGHQIVSQRAMVAALVQAANNDNSLSEKLSVQIKNIKKDKVNVISCTIESTAREAFEIMAAYGITSLPILNTDKRACGVISATDVLYARTDPKFLEKNVNSFVTESRKEAGISRSINCIVSCQLNDKLLTVLRIMMHEEVHHIYVLENDIPLCVISFVDILRTLCIQ